MSKRHRTTTSQPTQCRFVYLFGSDREKLMPCRTAFSAGGAGAVAC